jgi:hypothetical protein
LNTLHTLNGRGLNIPALVRDLLGEPNRCGSRGNQWRYGSKGSLAVDVARGVFTDFETGKGGGHLDLVRRVLGGSRADAAQWLKEGGWVDGNIRRWERQQRPMNKPPETGRETAVEAEDRLSGGYGWARLWREAQEPQGSLVVAYLAERGLVLPAEPGGVLRYHRACPFEADKLPAMVALIRNAVTGEPQGLHRTPLTPAGERARGPDGAKLPKMMLGVAGGGAIMLSPNWQVEASLAIAEGIESALAGLRWQPWVPTWAALSAGGVRAFPVLSGLEALTVYADADAAGIDASRALCRRYAEAGRYAEMVRPRSAGADLADLVLCLAQND